jgi:hypothetical protein
VVKACGKALRFGLRNHHPETGKSNVGQIITELGHVKAIAMMLNLDPSDSISEELAFIAEKERKVRKLMEYSRKRGTLQ